VAADQLRLRGASGARRDQPTVATTRADSVVAAAPANELRGTVSAAAAQSSVVAMPPAAECYRVETANGIAATWGADALPLVVRVDSATRAGPVLTVAGQATGSQAVVTRTGADSLLLRLRRIGFEGTLALGAPGDARAGVMRSRPLQTQLEQLVVTGASEANVARRRAAPAPAAKTAPSAAEAEARTAAPAVPVVARRVRCPG
jgi:hypothetical protein